MSQVLNKNNMIFATGSKDALNVETKDRRYSSLLDLRLPEPSNYKTYVRRHSKVGRNDPCPCKSGKKFKRCCIR